LFSFLGNKVIINLGEVDFGFVIFYRHEKNKIPIEQSIKKTINYYFNFINKISKNKDVLCISCPLPFMQNNDFRETDYNLRSKIKANLNTRIKLSVLFNKEMQRKCNEIGVNYLNLDSEILNKDGYVKKELIKKKKDHHYNYDVYSGIIKNRLKEINF
jgi:hypothetical protein